MVNKKQSSLLVEIQFGRIPKEVLLDPNITGEAVRVYGFLSMLIATSGQARPIIAAGQKFIAEMCHLSSRTVVSCLKQLDDAGHIVSEVSRNRRSRHGLTSPLFVYSRPLARKEMEDFV